MADGPLIAAIGAACTTAGAIAGAAAAYFGKRYESAATIEVARMTGESAQRDREEARREALIETLQAELTRVSADRDRAIGLVFAAAERNHERATAVQTTAEALTGMASSAPERGTAP